MVFFTYKSNLINWSISSMLLNFIHVVLLIIYSLAFLCNFVHIVEFIDIILSMWCGSFSINFIQRLVTIKGKSGLRTKSFLRIQFDICDPFYKNSSDDDFIGFDLDGMGYSRRLYKRQFQTTNLLEVDSKLKILRNKHFTSCNVSKCPYGS